MTAAEKVLLVWAYAFLALVMLGALWAVAACAAELHRDGMARVRRAQERAELRERLRAELSRGHVMVVEETVAAPTTRSLP